MHYYRLGYTHPHRHFIDIECWLDNVNADELEVRLPAWRPGRYQLSDFAKNIQRFGVVDGNGNALSFHKTAKDRWLVSTQNTSKVVVRYNFYANQLDAGNSFLSADQLYVNPVNCLVFFPGRMEEECTVSLDVPENYKVAISLPETGQFTYRAAGVHELMDSPFIASASIQHAGYKVDGVNFNLWFQGQCRPDWDRLLRHFRAFSREQVARFGEMPVGEYHFFYQILPEKAYHGVEHLASTVIALGPGYGITDPEDRYRPLLGVSSHELYHSWNIKSIRPVEMMPYDYNSENYSALGYVAEGVTSYMGDLMLLRAGVFSMEEYLEELGKYLQRHFDNEARWSMPVAGASFDTWLDGYEMGVPNRKTSIYVEGAMIALICHVRILESTGNKAGLDTHMKALYQRFAKKGTGYSEDDYWRIMEEIAGRPVKDIRHKLANGTHDMQPFLEHALDYLGLNLRLSPAADPSANHYGFKMKELNGKQIALRVATGGPADKSGLAVGDEVLAVNGNHSTSDFEAWLKYFLDQPVTLFIKRKYETATLQLEGCQKPVFKEVSAVVNQEATNGQLENQNAWCGSAVAMPVNG